MDRDMAARFLGLVGEHPVVSVLVALFLGFLVGKFEDWYETR